jgi:hypothetical protein
MSDSSSSDQSDRAQENARQNDRVTINKEFASFDEFIEEYVTNISLSGAFIKSKSPLPIGTLVNLRFTVIMDDIETVEGVGEVVRVNENPSGMGVLFREISSYSKGIIEKLLVGRKLDPTIHLCPEPPLRL